MTVRFPSVATIRKPVSIPISSPPGAVYSKPTGGFLLLETGDFILLEDGGAGLYTYDFTQADGAPVGFTAESGTASVVSNQLVIDNDFTVDLIVADTSMTESAYSVEADFTPGASYGSGQRAGLLFRYVDTANYYYVSVRTGAFGGVYLYRYKALTTTLLDSDPLAGSRNIPVGVEFNLRVEVSGTTDMTATIFLDDVELFSFTDSADPLLSPGQVGLYQNGATGDDMVVDNLIADESVPSTDKIILEN